MNCPFDVPSCALIFGEKINSAIPPHPVGLSIGLIISADRWSVCNTSTNFRDVCHTSVPCYWRIFPFDFIDIVAVGGDTFWKPAKNFGDLCYGCRCHTDNKGFSSRDSLFPKCIVYGIHTPFSFVHSDLSGLVTEQHASGV